MPNTRKKLIKTTYKDEESENEIGDFSDSGSEAHISEESGSEDDFLSNHSSEEEFDNKSKKKMTKFIKAKPKFTKTLINIINKQNDRIDSEPTYTIKDLTEEDKLLPSILNLSESDSSDDDTPKPTKKVIPRAMSSIKEDVLETEEEVKVEYKNVFSNNISDNSDEIAKKTFMELEKHHTRIEETKASINKYSNTKQEKDTDVKDLLALGEEAPQQMQIIKKKTKRIKDESDSDIDDWEEVNENKTVPQQGLELFVEFPNDMCRKKKKVDVEMMMKRRINRVKKEQQVYLHKVHVLSWIGHGNYVNYVLNDQEIMAVALTLIPSKECYPGDRVDMKYLEQLTKWYKDKLTLKQDRNEDKFKPKAPPLKELLLGQIKQKVVTSKKYLVFIFIAMLRALGIQCRVMFNFVTLPLKPLSSDLCSLSLKTNQETKDKSKTSDKVIEKKDKKYKSSIGKTKPNKENLSQIDGQDDHDFDNIIQVDGNKDSSPVQNKRITRSNKNKVGNVTAENEDVSPAKIPKKRNSKAKDNLKHTNEIKLNASDGDTCVATVSKLSLSIRKKENSAINKNEVTNLNKSNKSISPRKTRSGKNIPTVNLPKKPAQKLNKPHVDDSIKKENKLDVLQLTVTKSDVSSKYFKDKENNDNRNVRLSRKRSHTAVTSKVNDSQQKETTKARNKSDPGKAMQKSKYFSDTFRSENDTTLDQPKKQKNSQKKSKKTKSTTNNDVTADLATEVQPIVTEVKSGSKNRISKEKHKELNNINKLQVKNTKIVTYDSEDDFKPTKISPKASVSRQKDRRVLSSDDEAPKNKNDVWCEVFVEELEQWICIDIIKGKIHDTNGVYAVATHPVCYIIGWDNNNYLKDLTRRYVPHWNTVTRKLRANPEWFNKAIESWLGPKTARDKEENEYLDRMQLEAPLPKSISEYKNHPLYALKRHLLKFEVIYPPGAATLGFIRGEPVYSRDCVYVCRSREIWLKEAKVVRLGEEPYKIVKARPKWDKLSNKLITDKPLEVFGPWQVQDYEPPVAENGIVPRNAYGNVELFKECMLPKGTVVIKLPGLNRVARKLNIDCAPAMTGFDYTGGWAHPVFDGFVVCKEFEEVITEAWLKDQEEQEQRQREKLENRVYGNWRKLIKGLLIRERVKSKYGFEDLKEVEVTKNKSKEPRLVVKKKY